MTRAGATEPQGGQGPRSLEFSLFPALGAAAGGGNSLPDDLDHQPARQGAVVQGARQTIHRRQPVLLHGREATGGAKLMVSPPSGHRGIVSAMWRLALFVGIPLLELYVLSLVEDRIGLLNTLGLVVATGLLGATVMRRQGAGVWRSARLRLARGELPAEEILGGMMVLVGGALMITPGIITDGVGLVLMLPPGQESARLLLVPEGTLRDLRPPRRRDL